jgi:hypothetical protein
VTSPIRGHRARAGKADEQANRRKLLLLWSKGSVILLRKINEETTALFRPQVDYRPPGASALATASPDLVTSKTPSPPLPFLPRNAPVAAPQRRHRKKYFYFKYFQ